MRDTAGEEVRNTAGVKAHRRRGVRDTVGGVRDTAGCLRCKEEGHTAGEEERDTAAELGFTRYYFTSRLLCTNQSSWYCPPTCTSNTDNTIARPLRDIRRPPPTPPLYAIHNTTILAMAISCKGQQRRS